MDYSELYGRFCNEFWGYFQNSEQAQGRKSATFLLCNRIQAVNGVTVTVYDEVDKKIKKDQPSRLHARRQMLKVLNPVVEVPTAAAGKKKNTKEVDLVAKLFDEIAPKYTDRKGGYTRIVKIGERRGDGAMVVILELV